MTDGAEPVQVNYITDFPRHISGLFLFVFCLLFCVPMVFQHFFFVHVTGSLTHVTFFTQWISRLISEQNSSLLALLDCQEFPEVKCSLTITPSCGRSEGREHNGGPPPLALMQELHIWGGGGGGVLSGDGVSRQVPCVRNSLRWMRPTWEEAQSIFNQKNPQEDTRGFSVGKPFAAFQ